MLRSRVMSIVYLLIGIAGFIIGVWFALPALVAGLKGEVIPLADILPFLTLALILLLASGICLWRFASNEE